jgi:hypothetical protein
MLRMAAARFTILNPPSPQVHRLIGVMKQFRSAIGIIALVVFPIGGQTIRSFVGTVAAVEPDSGSVAIQPDNGDRVLAKISSDTILQRVAPGEKDLKKATTIRFGDIGPGDRVLVSLEPGTNDARRIVVMSAADITKRNEADRQGWLERGVSGVVTEKKGDEITLLVKSPSADKTVVVAITGQTTFRRCAPDSVRFVDAKPSKPEEVQIGDQLRARGQKSADGSRVTAENVVFGTFQTKAGAVTLFDTAAQEIRITEMGTGKPLVVKLTGDTQIKALPDFGGPGLAGPGTGFTGGPPGGPGAAADLPRPIRPN